MAIARQSGSPNSALERLPVELLQYILEFCGIRSLHRLLGASLRLNAVVASLRSLTEVHKVAGGVLSFLLNRRVLDEHSAKTRQSALRQRCCVCCDFGPFIFLPTCERCCHSCLLDNPALWVTDSRSAIDCFHLTSEDVRKLPVIRRIDHRDPDAYTPDQHMLVSVRDAKALCLKRRKTNGAIMKLSIPRGGLMLKHLRNRPAPEGETDRAASRREEQDRAKRFLCYRRGALDPFIELEMKGLEGPYVRTKYARYNLYIRNSAIAFPYLSNEGEAEQGIWCKGCTHTLLERNTVRDPGYEIWEREVLSARPVLNTFHRRDKQNFLQANRVYTRSKFVRHIELSHATETLFPLGLVSLPT
jgi:hypothetical protein